MVDTLKPVKIFKSSKIVQFKPFVFNSHPKLKYPSYLGKTSTSRLDLTIEKK